MRKNMQLVKAGSSTKQNVRLARFRSAFSPKVMAANAATFIASTAATEVAKNVVKKKLQDPNVQADLYALFKRKVYGHIAVNTRTIK